MKVTHINTFNAGGAANAAIRLHKGLLQQGIDSKIIFRNPYSGRIIEKSTSIVNDVPLSLSRRAKNRLKKYWTPEYKNRKNKETPGNYEILTFPVTSFRVEDHPWVREADIVHLHWVADFINYPTFFNRVNKPIVWTLHDYNPIAGIFHYPNDLERNKRGFQSIDEKYKAIKEKSLSQVTNLTIVTPSVWLGDLSSNSRIFKGANHKVIPNGIDTTIFKPFPRKLARDVFNLPDDKIIILFASENINNHRKGFDLLMDTIKVLSTTDNLSLCTVGRMSDQVSGSNVFNIGYINDERLMALLYAASDLFILPALEDNFPNTMLESLSCSTPVISFNIGGMKDVIQNDLNGLLVEEITSKALAEGVNYCITNLQKFDRSKIREFAVKRFDLDVQSEAYLKLYESILKD